MESVLLAQQQLTVTTASVTLHCCALNHLFMRQLVLPMVKNLTSSLQKKRFITESTKSNVIHIQNYVQCFRVINKKSSYLQKSPVEQSVQLDIWLKIFWSGRGPYSYRHHHHHCNLFHRFIEKAE